AHPALHAALVRQRPRHPDRPPRCVPGAAPGRPTLRPPLDREDLPVRAGGEEEADAMNTWTRLLLLAPFVAAIFAAACNDNDLGLKKRRPTLAPETRLSSGPRDSTTGANYKVHLFWSGADQDGTIDHYDFIMIDHPAIDDSIAPTDSTYMHRVVVTIPPPDDKHWTATNANDTLIVTVADVLRHDPRPPADPTTIRQTNFERWHTFFVRAV